MARQAQQLMTQKAYAQKKRVSPQYINKLVGQGKIKKVGSKIDARQADAVVEAFRRPGRVVKAASKRKAAAAAPRSRSKSSARSSSQASSVRPDSATSSLTKSRAKREEAQAQLAELDLRKAMRELLPASEVLEAERRKNANVRTSFRRLARSLAPLLHRATSPADVERLLLEEIDIILGELARDPLGMEEAKPAEQPEDASPAELPTVDAAVAMGMVDQAEASL